MKFIQVRQLFHHYVVFTKSIIFILGLILSYKLVQKTFLNILITHLARAWQKNEYDLRRAVVIVNLHEGASAVLVLPFVYVADVHTGRFIMVVVATAVCIIGLFLNFLAARNENDKHVDLELLYSALGLMTLAQAALTSTLPAFLDDQFRPMNLDEDQRQRGTKFWWTLVSFVAAIFSQYGPLKELEFGKLAMVLAAVTGGCFLVFVLGFKIYHLDPTIENPIKEVGIVVIRAIENRHVEYPRTDPQGLFHNSNGDMQILPRVPWLRWLEKAAIAQGPQTGSSAEQVRRVKRLFKMLPLWSSFLTLSLVAASGSTFFFEEAISLVDEDNLTPILPPIIFLANLVRLTEFVVSESSSYVIRKLRERHQYNQQKMQLVRIGIGMSCCVPCCIAAWATATRRRQHTMSVYWLTPQYFLLGLMGGLSEYGLESFYESQMVGSLLRFGWPSGEFVMGIGEFMSIPCILIFSMTPFRWFRDDLENSRLDKYYILLAVLSLGNVMIYCLVGWWYGGDAFLVEDEEMGNIAQQSDGMLVGDASRSVEGQHISHRSLSHRSVSVLIESGSGDATSDSSGSGEEAETEPPQDPLLGSSDQSTRNSYALLRAVTAFSRLFSRAARRRSNSKNE